MVGTVIAINSAIKLAPAGSGFRGNGAAGRLLM